MRYRYSTSFALGYLVDGIVHFFVDMIVGAFELIVWLARLLFQLGRAGTERAGRESANASLEALTSNYLAVLVRKRRQLLYTDDYGVTHPEKWAMEVKYFIETVAAPQLGWSPSYVERNLRHIANTIEAVVADTQDAEDAQTAGQRLLHS